MDAILEKKNLYILGLAIGISLISIVLVLKFTGITNIEKAFDIPLFYIITIFAVIIASLVVDTLRVKDLLKKLGEDLCFSYLFKFNLATFFISYVTPFGSGVLPLMIYLLNKKGVSANKALIVFTAKLLFSGIFFVTIPPFLLIFFGRYLELGSFLMRLAIFVTFFLIGLLILLLYIILRPHFLIEIVERLERISFAKRYIKEDYFKKTKEEILLYHKNFRNLFASFSGYRVFIWQFLYAVIYWMLFYSIAPLLLMAMKIPFDFLAVVGRQIIFYDVLAYSFIPSGSGTVELGFAAIFSNILPTSYVGVFIGMWRFFTYYVYLGLSALGFFAAVRDAKKEIVNQITN
ncbi:MULTISPECIES: lysylphosphatidylglycerol synthase transmembrane domain-containing protein [Caldanaerobacter]|uniref:Phosphatidylglycerol lysyltransferase n=4 Tax=Caldanaerobacter subterraneus TaxID=911092 RepID=Q8R8J2_CALS4|nr:MULTISPECIES: lysylphosphatidylglycerol synthase transmembrane domain-containing protein [Caldanaerobacter]AAM25183.1 predicted integral membrane protein [Caldanaerobacter subterraneus subsp. tengcongensis MB4]ERM92053.1 membrane protein [Caldanaerobacter subterraneus subsp. yonseiensis KB-1]KKC29015.1 integral membrane protein [Caldanaerobacter subterraneus subsp. pacificus DSM 12653]MCS3915220.1 uncharacterized protein (TIRG00374 family) [Caldanaerobacter subterraneus subsp. tengcongensis 